MQLNNKLYTLMVQIVSLEFELSEIKPTNFVTKNILGLEFASAR